MGATDVLDCGCQDNAAVSERCGISLPDSPQCAINYHFGMLLGVDDFRAEQGFNVGRLRRHQRALHGYGVVWGYPVAYVEERLELQVGAGYALDPLGRDLVLDATQCLSLAAWWEKHRADEVFADFANPDNVTFDADVVLCYANCLSRPVPAIAAPCADGQADIAYSRLCETITLTLVRRDAEHPRPAPPAAPYHLLRVLLGLEPIATGDDDKPLADDQWLLDQHAAIAALDPTDRPAALASLWQATIARAAAATGEPSAGLSDEQLCLPLARLGGVHIHLDPDGWRAEVATMDIDHRPTLLATELLQEALLRPGVAVPPLPVGPVVVRGGAASAAKKITLTFDQTLAVASVTPDAFAASEFVPATGWAPFTVKTAVAAGVKVTLTLDRTPQGKKVRVTVIGTGSTPLLSSTLIPAGALSADSDGQNLTTTI
jgi:hypothetical protein